jgi:hypothetical protein
LSAGWQPSSILGIEMLDLHWIVTAVLLGVVIIGDVLGTFAFKIIREQSSAPQLVSALSN